MSPRSRPGVLACVAAAACAVVLGVGWWVEGARLLPAGRARDALAYQAAVERQLAERVAGVLRAVVGPDEAVARVAATLDFARVERTEELFDPDRTVVRRQRSARERPGAADERREERQTYELSKVVSRTVVPAGALKQVSVAVLVDGSYSERDGTRVFTPRPQAELDGLKELVKSAVGFSEVRGDRITVASVPLRGARAAAGGLVSALGRWTLVVAIAAAILVYALRPSPPPAPVPAAAETERCTRENVALARQHPERAADLVREWLRESATGVARGT
jgi:flagellar biosynthesis/type III secretory pathway M-ring protein FliF/YscJ